MRNCGVVLQVTEFINNVTDELMRFSNLGSGPTRDDVRKTYLRDLCLTFSVLRPQMEILSDVPFLLKENDHMTRSRYPVLPGPNLLTSAAAVGKFEALHHFIAQGADPLGYTAGIITTPIKAAAVCGHTPMVCKLVEIARLDFHTLEERERDWILFTFETAQCHAIKAGDAESLRLLLEFFVAHRNTSIPKMWPKMISEAAKNGKTETLVTLLKDIIPKSTERGHQSDLQETWKESCKAGHAELVRRLLGDEFALVKRDPIIQKVSLEAARFGHGGLVELLKGYGAHIESQHLVQAITAFPD
ncbi:hypothetical protein BKA58DRAFT_419920 [Alternaria rosae]|uniref:uncharacterized protein n=1 Tax=Alternaria rosae TaxID=1187941 RepID=UPI001E8D19EA|nr:uncharacterized protein BKA58DRAFT_419920 [Alternaria rosae]KAH6872499.1 hypothetical protein BKA58DRAFT_419920 [Alternaria rosae]